MLVRLENLSKRYSHDSTGDLCILRDINLTIHKGEFIMIMGASGSGKTTLLNILGLIDRPSEGRLEFNGQPVADLSDRLISRIRGRQIGYIFQSFNLLQRLSARNNIEMPLMYQRVGRKKRRQMAERLLQRVGLEGKGHHKPSQLSGGEQQRVAIARALAVEPDLLLADEPTGNLDTKTGAEIMDILKQLNENGITIVMVTHAKELEKFASRVIVMIDGCIQENVQESR